MAAPSAQDPEGFWQANGYSFPMVHDVDGGPKFNVEGIPTTLFIDAKGNLVDKQVGGMDQATFESKLSQILR